MNNIMFMTLNLLLALTISAIPFRVSAVSCYEGHQTSHITGLKRLAYGTPVTLDHHSSQTVRLSSDSGGNSLTGKVAVEAMPASVINYWQGDTASAPDISAMMIEGHNTLTVLADESQTFWLLVESPCPLVPGPDTASVKAEPAQSVITPQLSNASTTKPVPVASGNAPALTPIPADAIKPTSTQRILFMALTAAIILVRLVQVVWIIGAVLLAIAGLVVAFRYRRRIMGWITEQIQTLKEAYS